MHFSGGHVHLSELHISNFRKLHNTTVHFQPGLNIIVGANNVGKTAIIDALRALLAGHDEPFPRLFLDDIHRPAGGKASGAITFHYVFRNLTLDDEADFLPALKPTPEGILEAHLTVQYLEADKGGRLKVRRWCGDHDDLSLTSDILENLRGVYLPPLRDASQGLRPSRTSQLARLLQLLADDAGRDGINALLGDLDKQLKQHPPIAGTQTAISGRHASMLGEQLAQNIEVAVADNLSPPLRG
jgi:putative ATP-dependent endonuclease of OLD family